jgi:hypothetical protein
MLVETIGSPPARHALNMFGTNNIAYPYRTAYLVVLAVQTQQNSGEYRVYEYNPGQAR